MCQQVRLYGEWERKESPGDFPWGKKMKPNNLLVMKEEVKQEDNQWPLVLGE